MCAIATILIAEDDDNDFFFLERALRKTSFEGNILRAADGSETIEVLQTMCTQRPSLPALGLIDLKMPRCDGFAVLAWRQKHCELSCIPLIVLSSSRIESDVRRAYDLGASSFTMKPMIANDYVDLCMALQHWWEHCEFAEHRDALQMAPRSETATSAGKVSAHSVATGFV